LLTSTWNANAARGPPDLPLGFIKAPSRKGATTSRTR